ncbi:Protein yippee-like F37A8-like protein [Hapsidospora chrysogenum ATCC 11550]|uniref:Protein yippee-like F37A8-like protein n=1 Tax=Hapsidospora chrysogenum (strain ATCC 11550 / CBS 779.69 / DSM 880 / IAM 14645 / JCM 23072 / IMI 49137) TaxID=857340 RepID=A0A086T920_HAPC1|nr:Protein yippee-like F37A8-like protein [Hapsidospora chrysogenum ATCC 11550]
MVRESGISATKPIFPIYLLPSLKLPFRRRSSVSSAASPASPTSPVSVASSATTPGNSPPKSSPFSSGGAGRRLSRTGPDTLRCIKCSSDLAFASQIISKGFTGRLGRAYLVAPPPAPADPTLLNIRVGRSENRHLVTGWHVVADFTCGTCSTKLGWKYVDAKEHSQKYKVGKFILETERVMTYRSWEDAGVPDMEVSAEWPEWDDESEDVVVFDSEDEDECEDIFAGTWDPKTAAKRRRRLVAKQSADD